MHGLGSSTSFWEAVVRGSSLSKTYRIVRHDTDGSGLSPISSISAAKQAGLITIEDYAEDLGAVMDFVGVEKAAGVIGHSMSGLVATHFAARYPHRVEKLGALSLSYISFSSLLLTPF
jgi:pimeloyl-ACP methyl ester carboxylesterase